MKKILHIAAFQGNIGDNASHIGFSNILDLLDIHSVVDRIEIRKTYNNYTEDDKIIFDDKFVELANNYDFVVFGGGGFLDYWVDGSVNGTTINIRNDILSKIRSRILITSIGSNPHREVPVENLKKYKNFLDYVRTNDNIKIALRNDGSEESIKKDLGEEYLSIFNSVLDHGFFYELEKTPFSIEEEYAAINITADQIEMYSNGKKLDNKSRYLNEMRDLILDIIELKKLKVIFVPHIFSDINAISELLSIIPDRYKRSEISIAPLYQGDVGTNYIFNIYQNSKFTIASRYHANVCVLNSDSNVIGLSPLNRINYIHKQFSKNDSYVSLEKGFKEKVLNLMNNDISINKVKLENLKDKTLDFYREYFNC
ncbi:polysaccharide pyruvyl transferase family protein [Photobacterium damselae]|uniref:polysaccharide pyruvyl transferase family protein n=1 Tax=Photobacterium damselae TaxID=38293 RepID=UPI0030F41B1E